MKMMQSKASHRVEEHAIRPGWRISKGAVAALLLSAATLTRVGALELGELTTAPAIDGVASAGEWDGACSTTLTRPVPTDGMGNVLAGVRPQDRYLRLWLGTRGGKLYVRISGADLECGCDTTDAKGDALVIHLLRGSLGTTFTSDARRIVIYQYSQAASPRSGNQVTRVDVLQGNPGGLSPWTLIRTGTGSGGSASVAAGSAARAFRTGACQIRGASLAPSEFTIELELNTTDADLGAYSIGGVGGVSSIRLAVAAVDAIGVMRAGSLCDTYPGGYPGTPSLPITNAGNPFEDTKTGGWIDPTKWPLAQLGFCGGVSIDPTPMYYTPNLQAASCEDSPTPPFSYVYRNGGPGNPCPMKLYARLKNESGADTKRDIVFLYGGHAVNGGKMLVASVVQHAVLPGADAMGVPGGPGRPVTKVIESAVVTPSAGLGGTGTGHPCAQVYIFPDGKGSEFAGLLNTWLVTGSTAASDGLSDVVNRANSSIKPDEWAQKNLSDSKDGPCPCAGGSIPVLPAAEAALHAIGGDRETGGPHLAAAGTQKEDDRKEFEAWFGPDVTAQVDEGHVVVTVRANSWIDSSGPSSLYNFIEYLGGVADVLSAGTVKEQGAEFQIDLGNPDSDPRVIELAADILAPPNLGSVHHTIDTRPFRLEPGENRTLRAALVDERACSECCLESRAGKEGVLVVEAEHFLYAVEGVNARWVLPPEEERFSNRRAMSGAPRLGEAEPKEPAKGARLEYRLTIVEPGEYWVSARGVRREVRPTEGATGSVRVAFSDGGEDPIELKRFESFFTPEWVTSSGDRPLVSKRKGVRTLIVQLEDPATVLDKIALTLKRQQPEGPGPSESPIVYECPPTVEEPPPQISISRSNQFVTVTWVNGGILQTTGVLPAIQWSNLGGQSPFTTNLTGRPQFFRISR